MRILADTNVPEAYVSALRGDGHEVRYSRDVDRLGPEATDDAIIQFAEAEDIAVLSTDVRDFGGRQASIPVFVAPQDLSGAAVRAGVARVNAMSFDPGKSGPIWLSSL